MMNFTRAKHGKQPLWTIKNDSGEVVCQAVLEDGRLRAINLPPFDEEMFRLRGKTVDFAIEIGSSELSTRDWDQFFIQLEACLREQSQLEYRKNQMRIDYAQRKQRGRTVYGHDVVAAGYARIRFEPKDALCDKPPFHVFAQYATTQAFYTFKDAFDHFLTAGLHSEILAEKHDQ